MIEYLGFLSRACYSAVVRPPKYYQLNSESLTLRDWSLRSGVPPDRIRERLVEGWTLESAIWQTIRPQGVVPPGICPRCGVSPIASGYCRSCKRAYRADWVKSHASSISTRICSDCATDKSSSEFSPFRSYCRACEKRRKQDWGLKSLYGSSLSEFESLCSNQENRCVFCKVSFAVKRGNLDHDHNSGARRGILCTPCNSSLGWYETRSDAVQQYLAVPTSILMTDTAFSLDNSSRTRSAYFERSLRVKHGMTTGEFDYLRNIQKDACAICAQSFSEARPNVDHDHSTGAWRGLLCPRCNGSLGWYEKYCAQIPGYLNQSKSQVP